MAQGRLTLMDPPIEDLLDKVDSKFTLVALGALRARQVNAYYNSLGEGLGRVVPPQVASVSGKPLSIAFEEIAASKATYTRVDPDELAAQAELAEAEAELAEAELSALEGGLAETSKAAETSEEPAEDEGPAAG
jgi:DNA-directed RNA polymerase subunit omega